MATSDPATLPATSTWYLATTLPRPDLPTAAAAPAFPPAGYDEIVRLYGLRGWVEQDYKQVKHELGWADFQVRSATAIARHWTLVNCAFSLCWHDTPAEPPTPRPPGDSPQPVRSGTPPSWPVSLRRVRACLTPPCLLLRLWQAWTTTPMPHPIRELAAALAAGHRLCLYLPP